MKILAIDPGTIESAYCFIGDDYMPTEADIIENEEMCWTVKYAEYDDFIIECMEPRTLNVGKLKDGKKPPPQRIGDETYETCIWIGRFMAAAEDRGKPVSRVYRSEERRAIVPSKRNKLPPLPEPIPKGIDAQIRAALIQRFAKHDKKNGKGTKEKPDIFAGFREDMWSAFAIGVTWLDKHRKGDV